MHICAFEAREELPGPAGRPASARATSGSCPWVRSHVIMIIIMIIIIMITIMITMIIINKHNNYNNNHSSNNSNNDKHDTVGFHNFNLRIFNLRVSNPDELIVDVFLTRCRISMCQGLGQKKLDEISEIDRTLTRARATPRMDGWTDTPCALSYLQADVMQHSIGTVPLHKPTIACSRACIPIIRQRGVQSEGSAVDGGCII